MNEMIVIISIGIAVNTLINGVWFFLISGLSKRIERLENLFINNNLKD